MSNKLLIIICAMLVAGGIGYLVLVKTESNLPTPDTSVSLITKVEPTASPEKQEISRQRIAELTAEIDAKVGTDEPILHLYLERAFHWKQLGELQLAFEDYLVVAEGDPTTDGVWNNLGSLRIEMGDVAGAETYFLQEVSVNPSATSYNKLHDYWTTYYPEERFDEIGPLLMQALEVLGPSASFYADLGDWYMEKQDYDEAVSAYGQAAVLNSDNQAIKDKLNEAMQLRANAE